MQGRRLCIVMVCEDASEASAVGQQMQQVNTASLVTYRKAEDLYLNAPAGRVVLIILASLADPPAAEQTLSWMRRRWPQSPIFVVGNAGGPELEQAARQGGASYLTRPVTPDEWGAVLEHVLGTGKAAERSIRPV